MKQESKTNLTRRLANFAASTQYEDLPPDVVAVAKNCLLDNVGVALAGSQESSVQMMLEVLRSNGGTGTATVIGSAAQLAPLDAALANAQASHVLDYDDTQPSGGGHLSASTVAPILTFAEMRHLSGRQALAAYVVGFDIGVRLSGPAAFSHHLEARAVHPTGFLGHFAATAAVGNLAGLDATTMNMAFGAAASQAAGMHRAVGTMAKGLHAGKAASDGLLTVLLAERGFIAPADILDGEQSCFEMFEFEADLEKMLDGLARKFHILDNVIKVFACAGWRNPLVEAVIHISRTHDLKPEDVAGVHIQVHPYSFGEINYSEPKSGLESKFSCGHSAAVAIAERAGGIVQFSDAKVDDPTLVTLRRKVTVAVNPSFQPRQIIATVRTTGGQEFSHEVLYMKGSPRNPLTQEELEEKFRANASFALPAGQVERLLNMLRTLDAVDDVGKVMKLCRSATR